VRLGHEMSMNYFSCLGLPSAISIKSALRHVMPDLCFCIRSDLRVTYCILVHTGCEILMHYFSCLGGLGAVSIKDELRHVTPNLFFASIGICGSHSVFQCVRGVKHRQTIFHAWVGPVRFPEEACLDMLHQTCVFTSCGICMSRSAF
jgi:hypothetical protein